MLRLLGWVAWVSRAREGGSSRLRVTKSGESLVCSDCIAHHYSMQYAQVKHHDLTRELNLDFEISELG